MQQEFQIQVNPEVAQDQEQLKQYLATQNKLKINEIKHVEILKRSIDARHKNIKVNLKLKIYLQEFFVEKPIEIPHYKDVSKAK